ncbi:MAG: hypothetical protein JW807_06280 [Spirochaetes bacterium]|nr:hypothetical protein [Spirochaetota bacterium]
MRRYMLLMPVLFAAASFSCRGGTIDLAGHVVFRADGAVFEYASFGDGGSPCFHTVRALKSVPDADTLEIVDVIPVASDRMLVVTRRHGLYEVPLGGGECRRIDRGIPPELIYPFKTKRFTKPILNHSVSADGRRIAAVVPCDVFLSTDGGRSFSRLPLAGVRRFTELVSVALHPSDGSLMAVGTSSNGVYVSRDGGATARRIRAGIPGEPVRSPNFLEEVRSLCFTDDGDTFYAGLGNGGGVYRGSLSRGRMEPVGAPGLVTYPDGDFYRVTSVNYLKGNILVGTNRKWRKVLPVAGKAPAVTLDYQVFESFMKDEEAISIHSEGRHCALARQYEPGRAFKPDRRARGRRALYISYSFTQRENYPKLLKLLRLLGLNAVVVNLKDDYGSIRVPVSDPVFRKVPKAVAPYADVVATIRRLQKEGIYVIGRLVCFKDEKLYEYRDGMYAVKNLAGRPFRKGPEKWVDGYSEFVWDYNIAVAREVERAGVDEVQFDYIRFPDIRGEKETRKFDFKRDGQIMREALVSFLKKARESLDAPISVDLFGYTAIYQWGEWIGQDVCELSRYVDVVCPMFYPSHYTGGYATGYGDRRIYYTIFLSCKRARELSGGVLLRPYIQAFYYKDNSDDYDVDYIGRELDGLKNCGVKDYIFWNDLSEYSILIRGLMKYTGRGGGPLSPEIRAIIPKKLPFESILERKEGPEQR